MAEARQNEDRALVRECLEGSERAWNEFYSRFIALMRTVVRKYGNLGPQDVEDITQSAFLSLTSALKNYDFQQSLPRFVCVVTERVLIDEYRKLKAAKRDGETKLLVRDDGDDDGTESFPADAELQDAQLERLEQVSLVRGALREIDGKCRDLITLRYLEELSFKEIADSLGSTENTVTVQTRRCLDASRERLSDAKRRGSRS
jgi:RNA polymerase sigma-70 factor, ECF subfamily